MRTPRIGPRRRAALLGVVALLAVTAVAACEPIPPGGKPGHTCTPARPKAAGTTSRTINHGGYTRAYRLHVPASYDGTASAPLVFGLHGLGSSNTGFESYSNIVAAAGARGYIVVTPNALVLDASVPGYWGQLATVLGAKRFWNIFGAMGPLMTQPDPVPPTTIAPTGTPDDVGFVEAVVDQLSAELCIDPKRVFSMGHSNGAGMSGTIACEAADRFAAVGAVGGINLTGACLGTGPVGVAAIHGNADGTVSYDGNDLLGMAVGNPSVPDRMDQWAADNGCTGTRSDIPAGTSTLSLWLACPADGATVYVTIDGWGHGWPSTATAQLLDFFDTHGRA